MATATVLRAPACMALALLLLAAAAPSCAARPARLLQQGSSMTMNVTAARVNATVAASNASGSVTRIDRLQLRKCQWDAPRGTCQLNAAYALSTDIPDPSEYGGWVLAGGALNSLRAARPHHPTT